MANRKVVGGVETVIDFLSWAPKSLWIVTALVPWKESYDKPRQYIKKQRYHFTNKGLYSQSYDFSSSHVQI